MIFLCTQANTYQSTSCCKVNRSKELCKTPVWWLPAVSSFMNNDTFLLYIMVLDKHLRFPEYAWK
jgi:hypothetical protein